MWLELLIMAITEFALTSEQAPPSLVDSNYYCESGTRNSFSEKIYYLSNPLWDGNSCSSGNTCHSNINLA